MSEPGSGYVVEEWNGDEEYNIIIILRKQIHRTSLTCLPLCFSTLFVLIFVAGPSDSRGRLTPSFKIISFDKTKYKGGQKVWNEISQDRCPQFEWWQWAFCLRSRQLDREHIFGTLHLRRTSLLLRVLLSDEISMNMKRVMKVFLGYDYFVSILLFCGSFLTWTKFWRHIHETHAECGRYHKVWPANIDECNVYFCSLSMYVALTPWCAISTILCLTTSGSGRPLTKTPPSWLTPPWPAVRCYQSGHGSYCV